MHRMTAARIGAPFNLNMPPSAVYDIRIQPRFDDLIVATHGRSVYIFDDLTPVQRLARSGGRGRDALRAAHGLRVRAARR